MNPIIDEYDDILAQMAGRLGGIENLLNAFFGFLHRRTDFYVHYERTDFSVGVSPTMGFPKGIAQQMLITAFSKYKMKYYPTSTETQPLPAQKGLVVADIDVGGKANAKALPSELYRLTDEGKQIPVGNGGFAQKYFWTQTLKEVTVYCDVGSCRGKDVKCEITPRRVHLEVKGELIINGDLDDVVVKDESMWNLNISDNSNPQIVLCLEKARKAWWKCVIVGDPEIDTTKVDSTQKIGEYDEQTQAEIRKIIAQQRDKHLLTGGYDQSPLASGVDSVEVTEGSTGGLKGSS